MFPCFVLNVRIIIIKLLQEGETERGPLGYVHL